MNRGRLGVGVGLVLVLWLSLGQGASALAQATTPAAVGPDLLPARLTDAAFWALSEQLSEPGGYFRSDNLLSNEIYYPAVMDDLLRRTRRGGVYLGVGPEQNFNYIVAVRPKMAFITDVRRGNLHTHLMYKALFELALDRADFISRLFSRARPEGLSASSSAQAIMEAFWAVDTGPETVYRANLQALHEQLRQHGWPLSPDDLGGIDAIYRYFYWFGPAITYGSSSGGAGSSSMASYFSLMTAVDEDGISRSFLASEEGFQFVKDLERRNLIVPVVGNLAGPTALAAVGTYLREHRATVSAFYISNVEQYLRQDGIMAEFCANVASMPLDANSTFIRSQQGGFSPGLGRGLRNSLGPMLPRTEGACDGAVVVAPLR